MPRSRSRPSRPRCLRPDCKRTAVCCGLCRSDDNAQREYVKRSNGELTLRDLELAGKRLPPQSPIKDWIMGGVTAKPKITEKRVLVSVSDRERRLIEQMRATA